MTPHEMERYPTGVRNLDALLHGGLPSGTLTVLAGPPGSGKTILAQQIGFTAAAAGRRVIYFQTLSEPTAKTLLYLRTFSFFSQEQLETNVTFIDLGVLLRSKGLEHAVAIVLEHVERLQPSMVVIDSFKVFDDLAWSAEGLRKFSYELAVNLMAWQCTTILIGEYSLQDSESSPLFSITDGLVRLSQREAAGEQQRFLQVVKMRGTQHSRDEWPFAISGRGIEVFAPRVTITRNPMADTNHTASARCKTGITQFDDLLGEGIPRGSSMLVGGVAGTGKTVLLLEVIYRGARDHGEKGIFFSFEETEERLRATARGLGWKLDEEIDAGRVEIVFIAQPDIIVEQHLLMMRERVEKMGARRVAIDSISVFLHKVNEPLAVREKVFQLASIIQNVGAVGFFSSDVPYGSTQLSRSGVEETVVDGIVLLSSLAEGMERRRYLEIYKLRNTAHLEGRHALTIGPGGIHVYPRYALDVALQPPPAVDLTRRLSTGIAKLDALLGGGLLERSVSLVSGSAGVGKSTLAIQFVLEGAARSEPALYIALEESPEQLLASADALGLPLRAAVDAKQIEVVYLARDTARDAQLLAVLTEKIITRGVRRLVLDGASHLMRNREPNDVLPQLLADLVVRVKTLGVTSVFTLESKRLCDMDTVTDRGLSPVADNLLMLRYAERAGALVSTLVVVKTRGSAHDGGRYELSIANGGLRVGGRIADAEERQQ